MYLTPIVTQSIYSPFITHPMTDTLIEAGPREIAQSAVQYSEVFIKTRAAFWPEHYRHTVQTHTMHLSFLGFGMLKCNTFYLTVENNKPDLLWIWM